MRPPPNPMRKRIIFLVIGLHALCLTAAILNPSLNRTPKRKPLVVNTILPKPTPIVHTPQKAPASTPKQQAPVQPKPTPVKHTPPKPTPKKEPAIADKKITTQKPPVKQSPPEPPRAKISDALKRELEESLAKLNAPTPPPTKKQSQPIRAHTLQIDSADVTISEGDYPENLSAVLQQALKLPEIGEVTIQLTLHRDGTVGKLVVLKTESQKNKAYLETHLPHIRCPRFTGGYSKMSEHTFTLTFCNE